MTECNGLPPAFSSLGRKRIQADFAGGKLTSDAGAAFLREVDRRIVLIDALADCITDPRQPSGDGPPKLWAIRRFDQPC